MSTMMEEEFKRWTAKRKAALVTEIMQGKTRVAEASRAFDIPPSKIEEWVDEGRKGLENALRAKPLDIKEQCVHRHRFETLQHASGIIGNWIGFYNTKRPHQALVTRYPRLSMAMM